MYTTEYSYAGDCWCILDPEDVCIAEVPSEGQAQALISHLNRG